jgi:glyoxylase-like metal-dependent hydrolase (beta-lactamase superfamily II)
MSYDGHVTAGGPAQSREAGGLEIRKLSVGPMDNNCYLLTDRSTGARLLIDAANDAPRLLEELGGAPLATVVTSHQHSDHWQALAEVVGATGAASLAHPLDAEALPVPPTGLVEHGGRVDVGDESLEVIHLRGHTPGSIALLYRGDAQRPHLFTGDCLFPGGPGNTEGDPERFASLVGDLEERVFATLPDQTWVYPGHGGDTTLGAERPHLQEWKERGW